MTHLRLTHLRLTHLDLEVWVDVRVREFDGRWLAVADLADQPDIGLEESASVALRGSLASLGEQVAADLSRSELVMASDLK